MVNKTDKSELCPCGSGKNYGDCCGIKIVSQEIDNKNSLPFGKDPKHIAGVRKELFIKDILEQGMLSDFVFKSPQNIQTKKEICDVMVFFDDVVVLFQIKTTELPEKHKDKIVKKGIKQIKGANRFLRSGRLKNLSNTRQGTINFDIKNIKHLINVVVLNAGDDYEYWGSTLNNNDNFIHLFDNVNFKEILNFLDTPPDFIDYLIKRKIFLQKYPSVTASELDLLGVYITYGHNFKLPEGTEKPDKIYLLGFWSNENSELSKKIGERKNLNKVSYLFDFILNDAHKCTGPNYIKFATEMSKFSRLERRIIGQQIHDTGFVAIQKQGDASRAVHFRDSKRLFYILFSNLDRESRKEKLNGMVNIVRYKYKSEKTIGIATEIPPPYPKPQPHSFDYFILEMEWEYDSKLEKLKDEASIRKENITVSEFSED